jgi:hypothetical protein
VEEEEEEEDCSALIGSSISVLDDEFVDKFAAKNSIKTFVVSSDEFWAADNNGFDIQLRRK